MQTRILFIGLALTAFLAVGNAQTTTENTTKKQTQTSFVDDNNNGVCDNYEARAATRQGNGQGKAYCRGQGNGNGQCLRQGNRNGQGKGQGNGQGLRNGKGQGQGQFVDANNNGVCDRRE